MITKKKLGLITSMAASSALLFSLVASPLALADNDHNNGKGKDDEKFEQKLEREKLGSSLEAHIFADGRVLVRGAKVTAMSSTTISAATTFGGTVLNWTINTDASTEFVSRFDGRTTLAAISVGDTISFQGMLVSGASSLTVQAKVVKDFSLEHRKISLAGTVASINASTTSFVLATTNRGNVTVNVSAGTQIKKGDLVSVFSDITVGGSVTVNGMFNAQTSIMVAESVKIRVPAPARTTVQGTLKSIASTTIPTSFVLTVGGTDFLVRVATDTAILNTLWLRASLSAFHVGDTVRVFGTVNADATIDATVVRNISIR